MFSQSGNLFRELMFSKSFQAWKMHGIHFVFQPKIHDVFDEFLQQNTLLMDTLCNFVWEMFVKLMEYAVDYIGEQCYFCCCLRSFMHPGLGRAQASGSKDTSVNIWEEEGGCKYLMARSRMDFRANKKKDESKYCLEYSPFEIRKKLGKIYYELVEGFI